MSWENREKEQARKRAIQNEKMVARASWSAGATFLASWIYCAAEYGFLFGFGLGWLPSAILAAIVFFIVSFWVANSK